MTPRDYEIFVSTVVKNLKLAKGAIVLLNQKYEGIRQPGNYEIDISFRTVFDNSIEFFMIVECKNWKRPVDRPVIQKLIQTRDAICAHKGAVVSPVGFSSEAVDVAKANGIALWILSKTEWSIIMACHSGFAFNRKLSKAERNILDRRKKFADRMEFVDEYVSKEKSDDDNDSTSLISFENIIDPQKDNIFGRLSINGIIQEDEKNCLHPWLRFRHRCRGGSAQIIRDGIPGVDPRYAISDIINEYGKVLKIEVPQIVTD